MVYYKTTIDNRTRNINAYRLTLIPIFSST